MENLNILVEAKREYLEQLSILMCPVMIDVFDAMYEESYKLSKGRKVLLMFQQVLRDVPEWSETMAKSHTDNITNRCDFFKKLVAAVFVCSVKILSAVRLSMENVKLKVDLPTNEVFIHSCYKSAAKDLYKNPYIFTENQSEHSRNDQLYDRFALCIENTVKGLIPVHEILRTYMTDHTDDIVNPQEMDMTRDDVEEYEEPMGGGGVEEPMGGGGVEEPMGGVVPDFDPDPVEENGIQPESVAPEMAMDHIGDSRNPFEDEFRTINSKRSHQEPLQEESEDLFPDASETRTKKRSY